jgi:hypothetical protein
MVVAALAAPGPGAAVPPRSARTDSCHINGAESPFFRAFSAICGYHSGTGADQENIGS